VSYGVKLSSAWVRLYGDDVCPAYTHVKQPPKPKLAAGTAGKTLAEGAAGLANLGNTCFMNSMVQCLMSCDEFNGYFRPSTGTTMAVEGGDAAVAMEEVEVSEDLPPAFLAEINRENILGTGGVLAEAWGTLTQNMFGGEYSAVAPREFKLELGKKASQFQGTSQQDAHEFLTFVLDALHEDLNRVRVKPITAAVESCGRPDHEVAAEAWATHKQRNDSMVLDKFGFQLRSHLTCPTAGCGNQSVTFDPSYVRSFATN
jgi:ubiquitin carboxyl-terminal hydrolase 19